MKQIVELEEKFTEEFINNKIENEHMLIYSKDNLEESYFSRKIDRDLKAIQNDDPNSAIYTYSQEEKGRPFTKKCDFNGN
jgi:hypothetical protein